MDADGERFEGEFIFGAVCNSTSLGGLVKLDPACVRMDDGMFELLLLRMPKTALDLQNLINVMTRMQYDYPGVILRHVGTSPSPPTRSLPGRWTGVLSQCAAGGDRKPPRRRAVDALIEQKQKRPAIGGSFSIHNAISDAQYTLCYQKDTISGSGLVVAAMEVTYSTGPSP